MKNHPHLTEAYLIVTNRCQMRCRYCWTEKDAHDMDTETALAAVKFILGNADEAGVTPVINFFGGEPLLCWDSVIIPVVEYVREQYKRPCHLGVTTNCLDIDGEKLRFLSANQVGLLVSMDGSKETHDSNRLLCNGKGSFDLVMSKVPSILSSYPNVSVRMTLTPETVHCFYDDVQFLLSTGFRRVECVPNCFQSWPGDTVHALKGQLRKLSDDYVDHFDERNGGGFRAFSTALRDVKRINRAYAANEHRCQACRQCGTGGGNKCAIDYLGDIYPCHQASRGEALWMGNIFSGIDGQKRLALASTYDQNKVRGLNCETCRLDHACDGICAVFNYMANGSFHIVPDITCVWRQALVDEAEYILGAMQERKNLRFRDYFIGL